MEPRLNIVTLGVRDLDKAIRFYRDGLGWPMSSMSVGDFAIFKLSTGTALALYPRELLALDANVKDPGGFGGITLAQNVATREEVDLALSQAIKSGGIILKPAQVPNGADIQDTLRTRMVIPGRLPGILIFNLSRVAWFCLIRVHWVCWVDLGRDMGGIQVQQPAPPGGHPIIIGLAVLFAALDLLHGPDGEVLQPGPVLQGLRLRPNPVCLLL